MRTTTETAAAALRALHVPGSPLVLPNAWDAASARLVAEAGFPAVATSSAATAAVLGFADGEAAPVTEVLAASARIAGAVDVPVTADLERGYGLPPAELVERVAAAGLAGLNLEDSDPATATMVDRAAQADFLAAVRAAATAAGIDLVINARIDVFLRATGSDNDHRVDQAVERATAYLAAGADCVYPIAAPGLDTLRSIAERVAGPVNAGYGRGRIADLAAAGIARVSFGPRLQRHIYGATVAPLLAAIAADDPFAL